MQARIIRRCRGPNCGMIAPAEPQAPKLPKFWVRLTDSEDQQLLFCGLHCCLAWVQEWLGQAAQLEEARQLVKSLASLGAQAQTFLRQHGDPEALNGAETAANH